MHTVFINKSKIHFESKSQQSFEFVFNFHRCLSISQRYILKANHNLDSLPVKILERVFINKSKIHFESKSQQSKSIQISIKQKTLTIFIMRVYL